MHSVRKIFNNLLIRLPSRIVVFFSSRDVSESAGLSLKRKGRRSLTWPEYTPYDSMIEQLMWSRTLTPASVSQLLQTLTDSSLHTSQSLDIRSDLTVIVSSVQFRFPNGFYSSSRLVWFLSTVPAGCRPVSIVTLLRDTILMIRFRMNVLILCS